PARGTLQPAAESVRRCERPSPDGRDGSAQRRVARKERRRRNSFRRSQSKNGQHSARIANGRSRRDAAPTSAKCYSSTCSLTTTAGHWRSVRLTRSRALYLTWDDPATSDRPAVRHLPESRHITHAAVDRRCESTEERNAISMRAAGGDTGTGPALDAIHNCLN